MELELGKQYFGLLDAVMNQCVNHEETEDIIVPDASPDVLRILGAFGNAYLKEEETRDGQYIVSGTICGWVLYVSEGDMAVRHLELQIPFSHTFDCAQIAADDIGIVKLSLANLEAREINPRKITVRANAVLCATVYSNQKLELTDHLDYAEDYGIECKTETVRADVTVDVAKKQFLLSDDIEFSESQPKFASMLRYDAQLREDEYKIIGSKAVVKGVARLHCLYLDENGSVATFDRDLPFSQIIEAENLDESCTVEPWMQAGDMKLEPQYDMTGDVHYLTLSLPIRMHIAVVKQQEINSVTDLYSIKHPLEPKFETCDIMHRQDMMRKRISVSESLMCDTPAERILDVAVRTEPPRKRKEEGELALACGMTIQVLYSDKEGNVLSTNRRAEAVCPVLDPKADYSAKTVVDGVSCSIDPGNELTVRCYVDFEITQWEDLALSSPTCVEIEPETRVRAENSPSVIVKHVQPGDTLWNLAKQYKTTVEEILVANQLLSSEIHIGDMLLIPMKER